MICDARRNFRISLRPAKVALVLATISVAIVIVAALAHSFRHNVLTNPMDPIAHVLRRFDLVEEPSLSQWFSSSLHLTVAFITAGIGITLGRGMYWRWIGLSAIFSYASLDEAIMIHEMMDRPTREFLHTSGFLSIAWVIPGSFAAIVVGISYLSFIRQMPFRIAKLFSIGGGVFLSGAILMEIPGGYLFEKYGFSSWHYILSYAIEELLEMLGVIIFLYGLLTYIVIEAEKRSEAIDQ